MSWLNLGIVVIALAVHSFPRSFWQSQYTLLFLSRERTYWYPSMCSLVPTSVADVVCFMVGVAAVDDVDAAEDVDTVDAEMSRQL